MSTQHPDELRRQAEEQLAARDSQIATLERADLASLAHELAVHQIELEIQNEELRRTRTLAEEARDRYLDLYDFAPVGYFTLDEHNRIVEANLTGCRLLHVGRLDLLDTRFTKFLLQEETDKFYFHRKQTLEGGVRLTCELKMQGADGTPFDARLESIRAGEDRLRVAVLNVTKRQRAEEERRESEERYHRLFEDDLTGNFISTPEGRILLCNPAFARMFKFSAVEEAVGTSVRDLYLDPGEREPLVERLKPQRKIERLEVWRKRRDGKRIYIVENLVGHFDERGELYEILGYLVDDTERKLMETTQLFLVQNGWAASGEDFFAALAAYLAKSLGMDFVCIDRLEGDGLSARTLTVYSDGKFEDNVTYALKDTPCGEVVKDEICCFPKDVRHLFPQDVVLQEMKAESYVGTILRDSHGQPIGLVAVIGRQPLVNPQVAESVLQLVGVRAAGEIERKGAEEALRDLNALLESKVAQRTADLERRARQLQKLTLELSQTEDRERKRMAEILHDDLQQIIAGAKFHVSLLRNRVKSDASLQALAAQIDQMLKDAIEKSRGLSHELSPALLHQGDFTETVGWLAKQMQAKHGVVVRVDAHGQAHVQSDAIKAFLYKTAQELLFNVVKHARVKEARIRVRRCGPYVCLSVSDRGLGFDVQGLREAAGFGLLSIHERIELLGGRMKIKSTKGKGSTFFVVVPDTEEVVGSRTSAVGEEKGPADHRLPATGHRVPLRVLLADDHRIVREGLRSLLREEPDVEIVGEAVHGREAVDLALRLEPDVVIMDVSMPLIDGDAATRQIKEHLPKTRVIALSTYNEPETIGKMYKAGAEGYVLKTASSAELLATLRGKESSL